MKPQVRQKIVDGELSQVLTLRGQEFQRFTNRKAALCAFVTALTLSGCATIEKHPVLTAVGVGFIAGSIAASTNHHSALRPTDIETPDVDCARVSCR